MTQFVFLCDFAIIHFSVNNAFSGYFFCKEKGSRVLQCQGGINVVVTGALSSTKLSLSFLKF